MRNRQLLLRPAGTRMHGDDISGLAQPVCHILDGASDAVEVRGVVRALQPAVPRRALFRGHRRPALCRELPDAVNVGLRAVGDEVEQPVVERERGRVRPPGAVD